MPFVIKDAEGRVAALYAEPIEGAEEVSVDDPALKAFLTQGGTDEAARAQFRDSDLALVRVIEDLIDTLIDKGVILFTDLPEPAQRKLTARRGLRKEFSYVETLFGTEEEQIDPGFAADGDGDGYI